MCALGNIFNVSHSNPICLCLAAAQFHRHWWGGAGAGLSLGAHKCARAEYRGEGTAFDGRLACTLQNACEAKPPLPRESVWDKINVSHIVLIAANKCLNDLMEGREILQGQGGAAAALEEVCGLITG